jgi:hypothetical protein
MAARIAAGFFENIALEPCKVVQSERIDRISGDGWLILGVIERVFRAFAFGTRHQERTKHAQSNPKTCESQAQNGFRSQSNG